MALDVNALQLDEALSWGGQQLLRVQAAGLWLDTKESLLEASGLVLSANNQLDPHKSGKFYMSMCGCVFGCVCAHVVYISLKLRHCLCLQW